MALGLLGLGTSIWGLVWYLSPPSASGCGVGDLPPGFAAECLKVTFIFHRTLVDLPLGAVGCGYFATMTGLCLPRAWRSGVRGIHALRLLLSTTGTSLIVYLVAIEPLMTWDRYPMFTTSMASAFLLFAIVATMTPKALRSAADDAVHRTTAVTLSHL